MVLCTEVNRVEFNEQSLFQQPPPTSPNLMCGKSDETQRTQNHQQQNLHRAWIDSCSTFDLIGLQLSTDNCTLVTRREAFNKTWKKHDAVPTYIIPGSASSATKPRHQAVFWRHIATHTDVTLTTDGQLELQANCLLYTRTIVMFSTWKSFQSLGAELRLTSWATTI